MNASSSDIREVDTTGLTLVSEHVDMTVWKIEEGRIIRAGDRTRSLEDAQKVFEAYDVAFRASGATPRPFEIVHVGNSYGIVVEWVSGFSIAAHLKFGSVSPVEAGEMLGEMALRMHQAHAHIGYDFKALYIAMADHVAPYIPNDQAQHLARFIYSIPNRDTLLHGDIHPGNVVINAKGPHLIDMDTIGFGHPVFDLACIEAFTFRGIVDKAVEFGMTVEECTAAATILWNAALKHYFSGWSEDAFATVALRIEILARLTRCFGSPIYLGEDGPSAEYWMQENIEPFRALLRDALPQVDRLDF